MLLIATAFVALMSEFLVGAVVATAKSFGMTEVFVGVILVAIIGNAAEHSTAVLMAIKNKMDIAINIAVGSSIQIALFVAPVMVFLSYVIGPQPMDLIFTNFEVLAITLSVAIMVPASTRTMVMAPPSRAQRRAPAAARYAEGETPQRWRKLRRKAFSSRKPHRIATVSTGMKCCTSSWRRPSNSSASVRRPFGVSKT